MPPVSLPARPGQPGRWRAAVRFDPQPNHRLPSAGMMVVAAAVSIAGSLAADAALVAAGTAAFPAVRDYSHFRFGDYGLLTLIGVVVACAAWPAVARLTAAPRWLFLRLAVAVTLVLWIPDLWLLLVLHEPSDGVGVLMVMHLGVALVTYNIVVRIAPVRYRDAGVPASGVGAGDPVKIPVQSWVERSAAWTAMTVVVCAELLVGVVALVAVPIGRPDGLFPRQGRAVYDAHALLGAALGVGAVLLWVASRRAGRVLRIAAVAGLVGVALGGVGGLLSTEHALRLGGVVLMFGGTMVGGFAYMVGALEPTREGQAGSEPGQAPEPGGRRISVVPEAATDAER
ncbi:MAG: hypothetical protein ACRDY3_13070 [Acidimicrobiales bacterium]